MVLDEYLGKQKKYMQIYMIQGLILAHNIWWVLPQRHEQSSPDMSERMPKLLEIFESEDNPSISICNIHWNIAIFWFSFEAIFLMAWRRWIPICAISLDISGPNWSWASVQFYQMVARSMDIFR